MANPDWAEYGTIFSGTECTEFKRKYDIRALQLDIRFRGNLSNMKLPFTVLSLDEQACFVSRDKKDEMATRSDKPYRNSEDNVLCMTLYQCDELFTFVSQVKRLLGRNNKAVFYPLLEDGFSIYRGEDLPEEDSEEED